MPRACHGSRNKLRSFTSNVRSGPPSAASVVIRQLVSRAVEDAFLQLEFVFVGTVLREPRARAQRLHRRGRTRGGTPHKRERAPEVEALAPLVSLGRAGDGGAIVEDVLEEMVPRAAQAVRQLLLSPAWGRACLPSMPAVPELGRLDIEDPREDAAGRRPRGGLEIRAPHPFPDDGRCESVRLPPYSRGNCADAAPVTCRNALQREKRHDGTHGSNL